MEFICEYITPENDKYCCFCKSEPVPGTAVLEDGRDYFFFAVKYIWFVPDSQVMISLFRGVHAVAQTEFYESAETAISEAFSGLPWQLPEGLIDALAPQLCSYARNAAEVPHSNLLPGALQLDLYLHGPSPLGGDEDAETLQDRNRNRPYFSGGIDMIEINQQNDEVDGADGVGEDELGRSLRESAAEIRMVPASQASIEALEEVKIERRCSSDVEEIRVRVRVGEEYYYYYYDNTCTVCLEELASLSSSTSTTTTTTNLDDDDDSKIVRMPCWHVYHKDCIVRWLKTSHLCPLCRYAMPHI